MVLGSHSERQKHVDGTNLLVVDSGRPIGLFLDADPDDSGHVTDAGVHSGPDLATLPETVVCSVGSEGQNQTDDNTEGWNYERKVIEESRGQLDCSTAVSLLTVGTWTSCLIY